MPIGQANEGNSSIVILSPRCVYICVRLTKPNGHPSCTHTRIHIHTLKHTSLYKYTYICISSLCKILIYDKNYVRT